MTAVGLLCRLYLGTGPRNSGIVAGVNRLRQTPPPNGVASMYYYYYASQVMHHVGGDAWEFWNPKMRQIKAMDNILCVQVDPDRVIYR